jgi:molybdopterin converting factor small subunit
MTHETSARVRLFGEFRNWNPSGEIVVAMANIRTVADLKNVLTEELGKIQDRKNVQSLMEVSALAGETRVLLDSENLADLRMHSFALLPPVCGG